MRRREFITFLCGAAAINSLPLRAQQAMPVIGILEAGATETNPNTAAAFRKGLSETGYIDGQTVAIEYYWAEGQYDQLPKLAAELVRRRVAVIITPLSTAATLAACAQFPVATNKSASLAPSRQASLTPNRTASFVTNKRSAVVTKTHTPFAANKHAARAPDALSGLASFYTEGSETASGEKLDGQKLTAAHRSLPFGTRVRVTNVANGRSVTVRINDRGPFVPGRVVDVSYSAAERLGIMEQGITKVKLDVIR